MSQRRPVSRAGSKKRPPPRKTVTEQFGSSRLIQVGIIAFAALIVCSLVGGALVALPLDSILNNDDDPGSSQNLTDPNEEFIDQQKQLVAENPDDVDAVVLLANVLGNSGKLQEAIPYYEQAVDLAPDDASLRLDFARALAGGGLNRDAELQFQKVLELDSESQEGMYYLAELYLNWSPPRADEAVSLLNKAVSINPDSFIAEQAQRRLDSMAATPVEETEPATPIGDGTGG